jgi:hypothetical protein
MQRKRHTVQPWPFQVLGLEHNLFLRLLLGLVVCGGDLAAGHQLDRLLLG